MSQKRDEKVDNLGNTYTIKTSSVNDSGNHYCVRDFGPYARNQNAYHYSNRDGSYYYSNPDGSKYYNSGTGYAKYTPPGQKQGECSSQEVKKEDGSA